MASTKPTRAEGENAVQLLKADHRKVQDLFADFEAAEAKTERRKIAEQIFRELEAHTAIEEELFYPAIERSGDRHEKRLVAESRWEHAAVAALIEDLRRLGADDQQFTVKFDELTESVEHQIDQEEGELFPAAEDLGSGIRELGAQTESKRQRTAHP